MEGLEGAGAHVRTYLVTAVPAKLLELAARLELEVPIAPPVGVHAQETGPLAVEDWPTIYVLPTRLRGIRLLDVVDGADELYLCTYDVELIAWVRADGYDETDTLRKRYALAIREALLARRSLSSPTAPPAQPGLVTIDPNSIREDASEVFTDREAGRTIAGVRIDVVVELVEVLGASPGRISPAVEDVVVDVHPGLA